MTAPIYSTSEIRDLERQALMLPDPPKLMEKAGLAAAQIIRDRLLRRSCCHILVLAGPGNNGGDAFVVARYLRQWGNTVVVVCINNVNSVPPDAKQAMQAWLAIGGEIQSDIPDGDLTWDVIVDGLFGIGLDQSQQRNIEGSYLQWIQTANRLDVPIVALDIPSGLGGDNGCVYGAVIRATMTVTFIGLKPGLYTNFGPEYSGTVVLSDLGIQVATPPQPHTWLLEKALVDTLLPPRRARNSHKGSFGNVAILGGATGMIGAALLAGRAALHLGAGRVYLGMLSDTAPPVDYGQPELMLRQPSELFALTGLDCLVAGPGFGASPQALQWLESTLNSDAALILDADALNLIAQQPSLGDMLSQRKAASILTPHPAEAARLLNTDTAAIQNNRMEAAHRLSSRFHCYAVLKGAGSICCFPDGERYINTSGNPGLSSAGTGDVLAGMIGALIAQGLDPGHAMLLAVYLHGAAADGLLQKNHGPLGMVASEVVLAARSLLNEWVYSARSLSENSDRSEEKPF